MIDVFNINIKAFKETQMQVNDLAELDELREPIERQIQVIIGGGVKTDVYFGIKSETFDNITYPNKKRKK